MARSACDDLDDNTLVTRFEALALAPASFGHVEHVRLAFALLRREGDFGVAALRFRAALRRFTESIGAAGKYHETLTWAYLAIVHERMVCEPCTCSHELIERYPELVDHRTGALASYYDIDAITASPIARRVFVLPSR